MRTIVLASAIWLSGCTIEHVSFNLPDLGLSSEQPQIDAVADEPAPDNAADEEAQKNLCYVPLPYAAKRELRIMGYHLTSPHPHLRAWLKQMGELRGKIPECGE